jgi:hypothetical protein
MQFQLLVHSILLLSQIRTKPLNELHRLLHSLFGTTVLIASPEAVQHMFTPPVIIVTPRWISKALASCFGRFAHIAS